MSITQTQTRYYNYRVIFLYDGRRQGEIALTATDISSAVAQAISEMESLPADDDLRFDYDEVRCTEGAKVSTGTRLSNGD